MRKPNQKLEKELIELRKCRGNLDEFVMNFLVNFRRHTEFMHQMLAIKPSKERVYLIYEYYIVGVVSAWETFYRDLFIFVYTTDTSLFEQLLSRIDAKRKHNDISMEAYNISLCELASKSFNFQNIESINKAFEEIFPAGIIKESSEFIFDEVKLNVDEFHDFSLHRLIADCENLILNAFNDRHQIIHNANYRVKLRQRTGELEFSLVLIPQISAHLVSQKYGVKSLNLHKENSKKIPFFFTVEGLTSTEWKPAPKDSEMNFIKLG